MMGSIEPLKWEDRSEDESIAEGLCIVKQWTCDHEWLEGEEWIGDVLAALFDEFRYDDIPYTDEGEIFFVPPALGWKIWFAIIRSSYIQYIWLDDALLGSWNVYKY